jgi:hypothetical protein
MARDPGTERGRRVAREAESERRPADPTTTNPRDALRMGLIFGVAALIAIAALGAMFASGPRYDGSPIPVRARG